MLQAMMLGEWVPPAPVAWYLMNDDTGQLSATDNMPGQVWLILYRLDLLSAFYQTKIKDHFFFWKIR